MDSLWILQQLRMRYCTQDKPYVIRNDEGLSRIISSFYQRNIERPEISAPKEYYQIKVVEMLLYLETMTVENSREIRPYYYKTQMEEIKGSTCCRSQEISRPGSL